MKKIIGILAVLFFVKILFAASPSFQEATNIVKEAGAKIPLNATNLVNSLSGTFTDSTGVAIPTLGSLQNGSLSLNLANITAGVGNITLMTGTYQFPDFVPLKENKFTANAVPTVVQSDLSGQIKVYGSTNTTTATNLAATSTSVTAVGLSGSASLTTAGALTIAFTNSFTNVPTFTGGGTWSQVTNGNVVMWTFVPSINLAGGTNLNLISTLTSTNGYFTYSTNATTGFVTATLIETNAGLNAANAATLAGALTNGNPVGVNYSGKANALQGITYVLGDSTSCTLYATNGTTNILAGLEADWSTVGGYSNANVVYSLNGINYFSNSVVYYPTSNVSMWIQYTNYVTTTKGWNERLDTSVCLPGQFLRNIFGMYAGGSAYQDQDYTGQNLNSAGTNGGNLIWVGQTNALCFNDTNTVYVTVNGVNYTNPYFANPTAQYFNSYSNFQYVPVISQTYKTIYFYGTTNAPIKFYAFTAYPAGSQDTTKFTPPYSSSPDAHSTSNNAALGWLGTNGSGTVIILASQNDCAITGGHGGMLNPTYTNWWAYSMFITMSNGIQYLSNTKSNIYYCSIPNSPGINSVLLYTNIIVAFNTYCRTIPIPHGMFIDLNASNAPYASQASYYIDASAHYTTLLGGILATNFAKAVGIPTSETFSAFNVPTNFVGNHSGDGSGLTNISPSTSLAGGTLPSNVLVPAANLTGSPPNSSMPYRTGFTNMPSLALTAAIVFSSPLNPIMNNTNYMVDFGEEGSFVATSFAYASAKTTNGFTLNLTTGITGGGVVTWTATPYTQTNGVSVGY